MLSAVLPNKLLLCRYKMRHFRVYKLITDFFFLQMRREILNTRATLQTNFNYPPPKVKVLHSYSVKQLAYFLERYKNVEVCILFSRQPESFMPKCEKEEKKTKQTTT